MDRLHSSARCVVERTKTAFYEEGVYRKRVTKRYFKRALRREASRLNVGEFEVVGPEVQALRKMQYHPSVVRLRDVEETHTTVDLTMDDAGEALKSNRRYCVEDVERWLNTIAEVVLAMHNNDMAHLDIKPENILLEDGEVKLGDFSSAVMFDDGNDVLKKFPKVTPAFASPEYCLSSLQASSVVTLPHAKPMDMWSLGVTLYTLLFGEMPFKCDDDTNVMQCFESIIDHHPQMHQVLNEDNQLESVPVDMETVLRGLLLKDPRRRFTAVDLHNYLA